MITIVDVAIFVIAFLVTVFAATVGIGGGLILVPVFIALGKLEPAVAAGTSLSSILVSTFTATIKNFQHGFVQWKISLSLAAGSILGAVLGARISGILPVLIWKSLFIIIAIYLIINMSQKNVTYNFLNNMFLKFNKLPLQKINFPEGDQVSIIGLILIGLFIGIMSATLGLGGGFLATPYLILGMKLPVKQAVATSVFMILMTATAGSISHILMGHFVLKIWMVAVLGTTLGGYTGAQLLKRFKPDVIKKIFLAFILLAILLLFVR